MAPRVNGALVALLALLVQPSEGGKRLSFVDEFDGYTLNEESWNRENPNYSLNDELQQYTRAPSNCFVQEGSAFLRARRSGSGYTSARISTQGKVDINYGTVEVRAKLPVGRGTWPAIWMYSDKQPYGDWPASGELDIMEHVGYDPDEVKASAHCTETNFRKFWVDGQGVEANGDLDLPSAESEMHTYRMQWTPHGVQASVDDHLPHMYYNNDHEDDLATWPFTDENTFYLIINIAIGGEWGGQKGIDPNIFPATMEVDWVRIYEPPIYNKGKNLLVNPDFSEGLNGWNTFNGPNDANNVSPQGGNVRFDIQEAGEDWHSQLSQQLWANEGQRFWLSFMVRSVSGDRSVLAYIQQSGGGWYSYGSHRCQIVDDSWSRCSVSGVVTDASSPTNFGLGAGGEQNGVLVQSALLVTNNLLENPDLDAGLDGWTTFTNDDVTASIFAVEHLQFRPTGLSNSPQTWKIQAYQTRDDVALGEKFTFSAELWTTGDDGGVNAEREVSIFIQQDGGDFQVFGWMGCRVTREPSRCSVTGTVSNNSRPVKFGVSGGESQIEFAMDNAILSQHYE